MTAGESVLNDALAEKARRSGDSNLHQFSNSVPKG